MIYEDVQIGDARLIRGDCLDAMPIVGLRGINMVFADLPYATARRKTTAHAWDKPFDLDRLWGLLDSSIDPKSPVVFTAIQPFASDLIAAKRDLFRYDLIYSKSSPVGFFNAKRQPMRSHEHVLVFYSSQPTYNPQMTFGAKPYPAVLRKGSNSNYGMIAANVREANTGSRHPKSVLNIKSEGRTISLHPTQKPITLLEWLILAYTHKEDTVLDPTAGSGTTAIAAINTGRKAICIEKDKTYFDIMVKRVSEHHAKMEPPKT